MRVFASHRLVAALGAFCVAAPAAALAPALTVPLAAGLAFLAGLVAWDALLLARRPPLALARVLPERAAVGREAEVRLRLRNSGPEPVEAEVVDELPAELAPREPRFARVRVGAGGSAELAYRLRPARRGDRPLGPTLALERSPLGWLRRRTRAEATGPLRVYPDATRLLRPEALQPRRVLAALGVKRVRARGEGMEFDALREYVPGDDPRRVDWRATARRGRVVTRLYREERNHTVLVAVDASRLMGGVSRSRSKLDHAVDGALALAWAALVAGDRLGMLVFDRALRGYVAPRRRRRDLGAFLDLLRPVEPRPVEADYRALVRAVAARQRQRALVVLLTDFVEAEAEALVRPLALLAGRHRVLLVALRDRVFAELDAGAPGAPAGRIAPYRRLVLGDLLREREAALGRLRRGGLLTLDLPPEAVTAAVLNRYLALRQGAGW